MNSFLELLKSWGAAGAFVVAFIDGVGLPNPGGPDYLILFLAWVKPESAWLAATLALAGSLLGSFGLYWIARKGGEKYLERRAAGPRARTFRKWFKHYGLVTVFIPALVPMVPLPMKVFVLCAGALSVNPGAFLATMAAGRVPRYYGLAWLGRTLGENSTRWLLDHKWHFAAASLVLLLFCFLLIKLVDRIRHADSTA